MSAEIYLGVLGDEMTSNVSAGNSCLLAVLLVVRSSSEPRLVFHYPPRPGEDNAYFKQLLRDERADSSSSSSEGESYENDLERAAVEAENDPREGSSPPGLEDADANHRPGTTKDPRESQWNDIFSQDARRLAKALSPPLDQAKQFEVSIKGDVYVGRPVYVHPDGLWRRRRRRSSSMSKSHGEKRSAAASSNRSLLLAHRPLNATSGESTGAESGDDQLPRASETAHAKIPEQAVSDEASPLPPRSAGKMGSKDPLVMFHVVYVLNPSPLEHHTAVGTMWTNVAKKFARALKYEQARSEYVSREVSVISSTVKRLKKPAGTRLARYRIDSS